MRHVILVAFATLAACFDPANAPSCTIACATDADCTEGQTCNTASGTCTAGEDCTSPTTCTPGEFVACVDGAARTCNATGDGTEDAPCGAPGCNTAAGRCNACVPDELSCTGDMTMLQQCMPDGSQVTPIETCVEGCVAATTFNAHCAYIAPVWMPNICDTPATIDEFNPNAAGTYDTNLATTCTGGFFDQGAGKPICVVRAKAITISVALTIIGPNPIAFVADNSVLVSGFLDASAGLNANGPGGGQRTSGGAPTSAADGGGGAGFGSVGGNGGGAAGTAGPVFDPLSLAYFAGGAQAYHPPINQPTVPSGGGGGGGVLLVACRGNATVSVNGTVDVGGGGGRGAFDTEAGGTVVLSTGGGGGGSGGYVVMQGLRVQVTGEIFANGGGGGGGNTVNDGTGGSGGNGSRSTSVGANGGSANGTGAAIGGGGAARTDPAAAGAVGTSSGGGGGGMGVIQLYTPLGVNPAVANATTSPAFASNKTVPTR